MTSPKRPLRRITTPCAMLMALVGLSSAIIAQETSRDTFRRDVVMRRFDKNGDGTLAADEVAALRQAFGGIDVPVLPERPWSYESVVLPPHMDPAELEVADNTPEDNPLTDAGAELGRVLFYDTQLSTNNTISCASCHHQRLGFSDPRQFSLGFHGGRTVRNAMAISNLRYTNLKGAKPGFFWDERAPTLEAQVLMPIQDQIEMGMVLKDLEAKLASLPYYPPLFNAAFGSPKITSERIARAVVQFMRSIVSLNSKFDRAAGATENCDYTADFADFTPLENQGKSLFLDGPTGVAEFGCAHCHMPPTFGMAKSFNNGLDLLYKDQGLGTLNVPTNDPFTPSNDGKFKAPSLRNVALTMPYMHDGRFQTLDQVIEHYSSGVQPHKNLGVTLNEPTNRNGPSGFNFTAEQKKALVAFLKTLTDESFTMDEKFADPFVRSGS